MIAPLGDILTMVEDNFLRNHLSCHHFDEILIVNYFHPFALEACVTSNNSIRQ